MKVAPSLLAADFAKLKEEVIDLTESDADYLHLDIMDGHFVPNISFGPGLIKAIRPYTKIPFDVHLMIENPDRYIPEFVKAGADMITVHVETCPHLHRTLQLIKDEGVKSGVALNPHTPIESIENILPFCDLVLVMSVNPGFGGQTFIETALSKIAALDKLRKEKNYQYLIEVDGGINQETGKKCQDKGTDILVAGSYVFKHQSKKEAIASLK